MPAMMPRHYEAGAKALDTTGDPFLGAAVKPPSAIRAGLGMTAPTLPKLQTFKAPRAGRGR